MDRLISVYCLRFFIMGCTVLAGGQWGDEGKGKIISALALKDEPSAIARAGVGPNAGHTIYYKGKKLGLREIPCGFVQEKAELYIGAGVLVDPEVFFKEIDATGTKGRIFVDKRCTIITPEHKRLDLAPDLKGKIGTTGTGCGPANSDRALRRAKLAQEVPELAEFLADVPVEVNKFLDKKKDVLVEGTQGSLLSLYYGYEYPFVTSKDTNASTFAADVGIGPRRVDEVIVVFKSYPSRVGNGPFPSQMTKERANELGIHEYGTVTGRERASGEFDFDLARYSCMLNSATQIAITCLDYVDRSITGASEAKQLTPKAKAFVDKVEKELKVPVTLLGTGPETNHIIDLRDEKL